MLKRNLKSLLLSFFTLTLIACSTPPTYSRQDIAEVIKEICKNEYGIDIDAWLVGETLWVHAPVKLFDESGKFKVSEEGKVDEDLSESLRKISQSIQRSLLNMETPPIFYCFVKSDIQRLGGIDLIRMNHYELVFVPDQIKLTLGTYGLATLISTKEFENRIVFLQAPFIASKILRDNHGRRIRKYDISLNEFLTLLIHQRIFNAFTAPEVKDNFEINNIDVQPGNQRLEVSFNIRIKKYEDGIPIPLEKVEEIAQKTLDSYSSFIDTKRVVLRDQFNDKTKIITIESSGQDAARFIKSSTRLMPGSKLSDLYRASFYLMQAYQYSQGVEKDFNKAVSFYKKTLEVVPDYIYAQILLGESYLNLGRYEQALAVLDKAIKLDSKNPTVYFSLGECYRLLGRLNEALGNFQKAFLFEPDYPGILEALSNIYSELGVPAEARQYLEQAIKNAESNNSQDPEVYRSIGNIYARLGQYQEALKYFEKSKELKSDYPPLYISLGDTYRLLGKPQEAIDNFEKALSLDPKLIAAKLGLAHTYLVLGQHQKSIDAYQEVLNVVPESVEVFTALAQAHNGLGLLNQNKAEHQKAIEYLDQALVLDPDNFGVYYHLGETYNSLKEYKKAVNSFNKALKLNPDSAELYFGLGGAYYALGENAKAKESFEKAHFLFYDSGDYINARKAEENMRTIP